ncbi:hypothetical protein CDD80_4390 [Ophiocordyceps camponoti-rufipedis]|uniref:Uncharacterized protein n=1 Tax=Ophiocordyceps camponoti-rufipedis TaxID=2004952 RepID=A0A2C5YV67_9HYPO|nr:hypothetical protein CDD80_4390 [Ophiocordyceps camponoti-rufipedis]
MASARLALTRLARWRARPLASRRAEASFAPRHGKAIEPGGREKLEEKGQVAASGELLPALDTPGDDSSKDQGGSENKVVVDGGAEPGQMMAMVESPRLRRTQPQMAAPPYVHHFDSYSLVKQLQKGGYTEEQATTAMKGIRALLATNLDVAQESLVSRSDVENVGKLSVYGGVLGA